MRKPDRLVQALKPIIDTVPKRAVVEQLCESLVPPAHRSIILAAFPPPSTAASPHAPITLVVNLHRMGGSGGGLGLSLRGGSEYGLGLFVSAVVDGSPADLGGLQRGDRLVSIEGRNTEGMSHAGAVELLVAAGEVVGLEIERGGEAIPTGDRFRLASAWRHKDAEQSRAQVGEGGGEGSYSLLARLCGHLRWFRRNTRVLRLQFTRIHAYSVVVCVCVCSSTSVKTFSAEVEKMGLCQSSN